MNVPKTRNVQERSATFAKVLEYEVLNVRYCILRTLLFMLFISNNNKKPNTVDIKKKKRKEEKREEIEKIKHSANIMSYFCF